MAVSLRGWKQIADYLGVSVRTAQFWEAERGLPVRRVPGGRSGVWADVEHLEAWRRGSEGRTLVENQEDSSLVSKSPLPDALKPGTHAVQIGWRVLLAGWPDRRGRRFLVLALVFLAIGAMTFLLSNRDGRRKKLSKDVPARWLVERRLLAVMNTQGEVLWQHDFADDLAIPGREKFWVPEPWLGDIDDDGEVETIFAAVGRTRSALICYSQSGAERWRFTPGRAVKTRREDFRTFNIRNFQVFRPAVNKPPQLVAVSTNDPYYPCQIALLSSKGMVTSEYWHSGHIGTTQSQLRVTDLDSDGKKEMLLCGISNSFKQATLVVLPSESLSGASVEEDQDYQLLGFGRPSERARILFCKSCLNRRLPAPVNWADAVQVLSDAVIVGVIEERDISGVGAMCFFDRRLAFKSIDILEQFQRRHQALFEAREIDHRFDRRRCFPEPIVRYLTTWR